MVKLEQTENKSFCPPKERTLRKTITYEVTERPFTTESKKIKRKYNKRNVVKDRVIAIRKSFFPTVKVSYSAVVRRMQTRFNLVDRGTILAYLGRLPTQHVEKVQQTVKYKKSGLITTKDHSFRHFYPGKRGYITIFDQGHLEQDKDKNVSVVWYHQTVLNAPSSTEREGLVQQVGSKNISLSVSSVGVGVCENGETLGLETREKRERVLT